MTTEEADEIFDEIERLAAQVEDDEELKALDPRYSITAKWIDCDIETTIID